MLLPLAQVVKLEKTNTLMYIPNALQITMPEKEEYFFASFIDRDQCYNLLNSMMEVGKRLLEIGAVDSGESKRALEFGYQKRNNLFANISSNLFASTGLDILDPSLGSSSTPNSGGGGGSGVTASSGSAILASGSSKQPQQTPSSSLSSTALRPTVSSLTEGSATPTSSPSVAAQNSGGTTSASNSSDAQKMQSLQQSVTVAGSAKIVVEAAAAIAPSAPQPPNDSRVVVAGTLKVSPNEPTSAPSSQQSPVVAARRRSSTPRFSPEVSSREEAQPAFDISKLFTASGISPLLESTINGASATDIFKAFWLYSNGYRY